MNQRFVPAEHKQTIIDHAIASQLRYIQQNAVRAPGVEIKWFTTSYKRPKILDIRVEEKSYPLKLSIDAVSDNESDIGMYMDLARKAKSTSTTDPGLYITYEAEHSLALCTTEPIPEMIEVDLPIDPELAYWFAMHSERITRIWKPTQAETITNPCAHEEIADLPWPTAFWYFWDPTKKHPDLSIDCTELLKPQLHVHRQQLHLRPTAPQETTRIDSEAFELDDETPLKVAVFFSLFQNATQEKQPHLLFQAKSVPALLDTFLMESQFEKIRSKLQQLKGPKAEKWMDISLIEFLQSLWSFRDGIELESFSTELHRSYLRVELLGRFKHSQRAVIFDLNLSETSPDNKFGIGHLARFAEALENADIIAYQGHSSMGALFTKSSFQKAAQLMPAPTLNSPARPKSYQVLLLDSCYSYQYFNPASFRTPHNAKPGFVRDLIFTGISTVYNPATLAQAVIRIIDLQFAGHTINESSLLDISNQESLLIFERHRPQADALDKNN